MNSIGVDFKLKSIEVDGKIIKLQIVSSYLIPIQKYNIFKYIVGYGGTRTFSNNYNLLL